MKTLCMQVKGKREVQDLPSKQLHENTITRHSEPQQYQEGDPSVTSHFQSKKRTKRIAIAWEIPPKE